MSNLYSLRSSAADIAAHFGASDPPAPDLPAETKPGTPGIVVREGANGRVMQSLRWGFPRPQTDRAGDLLHAKPVNLLADLTNPMWDRMVPDPRYRCLIPLTAFAQPEGPRGRMTRTWFSVRDWPIFAWAGFCRRTREWGPVYAAMTTDSGPPVAELNPRMPAILAPEEYERWLRGSIEDVIAFQFRPSIPAERFLVDRTNDLWIPRSRRSDPMNASLGARHSRGASS
jgi:putative SOS response-associated peptidase YedK